MPPQLVTQLWVWITATEHPVNNIWTNIWSTWPPQTQRCPTWFLGGRHLAWAVVPHQGSQESRWLEAEDRQALPEMPGGASPEAVLRVPGSTLGIGSLREER